MFGVYKYMIFKRITRRLIMSKHRTKKRFLAVGLAFSLVLATFQPVSAVTDTKGHWAERIINEAVANYIMQGSDDGTFKPDKHITREEFFAAVTNILTDKPDTGNTVIKFSDVKEGEWYVPYVKIAVAAGLTSGTGDGAFGIGRNITREEAAKIVAGVVYTEGLTGAGYLAAKDADKVSSWAVKGVDIMYKKGYIKGDESGNFNPQGLLTRAAAAKILLEVKKHENVINSSVNQQLKGEFTKGNGTKENPYQITNSAQLNNVRNFADKKAYFVLKNDIKIEKDYATQKPTKVERNNKVVEDFEKTDWTKGNFEPIGTIEKPFNGTFMGDGYKISGLDIRGRAAVKGVTFASERNRDAEYVGLFGAISKDGEISGLAIDNGRFEGEYVVGAFCGKSEGKITGNSQIMSNVIVKGKSRTGGFAGSCEGSSYRFDNLTNMGSIYGTDGVGGICGVLSSDGYVSNCTNKGVVETQSYNAGGIIGKYDGVKEMKLTNCYNEGSVKGTGLNGGIVGKTGKLSIENCLNKGKVEGNGAGGIAGKAEAGIVRCSNSGSVKGNSAGGIVDMISEDGSVQICYNEGSVKGVGNVGGIAGENANGIIKHTYNSKEVSGNVRIGGIAGKNTGKIQYSYNSGNITGSIAGSLIGDNKGRIKNLFWIEGSAKSGFGESTTKETLWEPCVVTAKELSGQMKVDNGDRTYFMVIDKLNEDGNLWRYLYEISSPPPEDNKTVVSDGGGVVAPIVDKSYSNIGNTISETDILGGTYLYPTFKN